jgi:hypothetical protein
MLLILPLLKLRLSWYRQTMLNKLIRFKHALIFLIAFFIPSASVLIAIITQPILAVIQPATYNWQFFTAILIVQGIYLAWMSIQKDAVQPASVGHFFGALPISKRILLLVDGLTLIVANNILWIPFIIILSAKKNITSLEYIRCIILIFSILALQLICLHNQLNFRWMNIYKKRFSHFVSNHSPLLAIQLAVLLRKHPLKLLSRLGLSCVVIGFAYGVIIVGETPHIMPCALIANSVMLLVVSGLFPVLNETRQKTITYFHSLPYTKFIWYRLDYLTTMFVFLIFSASFLLILISQQKITLLDALQISVLVIPLSIILCYTQTLFPRQGTFISIAVLIAYLILLLNCVGSWL